MQDVFARGLAPPDLVVITLYALVVIGLGLWAGRKQATGTDFFLASRDSTWPVIGFALLASNISSATLIGLAGNAYANGIAVYNYEWMATVVLVFFCLFFLPFILRSQVYTMPEFLERRYSPGVRKYFSALTIFLSVVVDKAATLYGGALMLTLILPTIPLPVMVLVVAALSGIYTIVGGLKAVLYTEVVQAVILLSASAVLSWFAFAKAGGWANVMANIPEERMSLIMPLSDPHMPWLGLLTGVPILGFYFWCTNQFMVQRVMSAKNVDHGRWGSLFAGLLKLPVLFLMVLPGSAAVLLYPNLPNPDLVYPTLMFDLLPTGLLGLVVAGFLAAIMSATASTFNSAATLATMDFIKPAFPALDGKALVRVGRLATLAMVAVAVVVAPMIEKFGSVWTYLQSMLSYTSPPIVAVFLAGLFWKRANARGAGFAIVAGLAVGITLFVQVNVLNLFTLNFLYVAPILLAICAVALVYGSLTGAGPSAQQTSGLMWTRAHWQAESASLANTPAWANYRVQSAILLAMTAVIVIWFW
ncbi:sodium:solute symporter [Sandaracinobacteroides saxicola]|uniref:Sodium/solute symporter n=1 Tax=Sandaracinobacteroides saxicola TaxID=2759707 RepID=A0A7G5IFP4_9SPHN|nr:sodium:solute symporter [Sandaracinobacteroides saxicola]QMW22186.1 sodium/solute symporter [Sandaracinobacteroides saxicola]